MLPNFSLHTHTHPCSLNSGHVPYQIKFVPQKMQLLNSQLCCYRQYVNCASTFVLPQALSLRALHLLFTFSPLCVYKQLAIKIMLPTLWCLAITCCQPVRSKSTAGKEPIALPLLCSLCIFVRLSLLKEGIM